MTKDIKIYRALLAVVLSLWALSILSFSLPASASVVSGELRQLPRKVEATINTASEENRMIETLPYVEKMNPVEYLIRQRARGSGVDEETAVSIAKCESSLEPEARSETRSAVGLYQFLIGTWKWIGAEDQGLDRLNPEHSLEMFLKWFPEYPGWWEECL